MKPPINWRDVLLKFMRCVGETNGDWHPELWESYGISREEARQCVNEYESEFIDHEKKQKKSKFSEK